MRARRVLTAMVAGCVAAAGLLAAPASAETGSAPGAVPPAQDPFYQYRGTTPLAQLDPGTVLGTRTIDAHIAGLELPITTVQVLYRSTTQLGEPSTTVTSVLLPPHPTGAPKLVSYQSAYDALSADCQPSYALAGGLARGLGSLGANAETAAITPFLYQGYTVVTSDFEGQDPHYASGPDSGMATLDGIRAALHAPGTGLDAASTPVGMLGYSGGAIATEWATELAPRYAPDVDARLVGAAAGGVLADPYHNLRYVDGTFLWAGVEPLAIIGIARSFRIDLDPYLSDYGRSLVATLQDACIPDALGRYPGLTFAQLVKPQYANPSSIPEFVAAANQLIMGTGGTPTAPLFLREGTAGEFEGTPGNQPGIGAGDGVMIAGDVRTLARDYCSRGVDVNYGEYPLSHIGSVVPFAAEALTWMGQRFTGGDTGSTCGQIAPGNPLTPIVPTAPTAG